MYRISAEDLRTVHDWVKDYERFWTHHLDRIKERSEEKMATRLARELQLAEKKKEKSE